MNVGRSARRSGGRRVIDTMKGIFKHVGTMVGGPVSSRGYPSPETLAKCKALGKALAEAVN